MPVSSSRDLHYSDYSSICPTDPGIPLSTRTPPYRRSYSLRLDADNPHYDCSRIRHSLPLSFSERYSFLFDDPQLSPRNYRASSYVPESILSRMPLQHSPLLTSAEQGPRYSTAPSSPSSYQSEGKPRRSSKTLPPGENNPNAQPGARLCFEYMNTGKCHRMIQGGNCRYRHLSPNHPDAIADRFKSHLLSDEEIVKYNLRPCEEFETNPFAPRDAPICFDFLNRGICGRTQEMKICRYRHLLPEHPEAIKDRMKSLYE